MPNPFTDNELNVILAHYLDVKNGELRNEAGLSERLIELGEFPEPAEPGHHRTPDGLRNAIGRFAAVDPDPPETLKSYSDRFEGEPLQEYRRIWQEFGDEGDLAGSTEGSQTETREPSSIKQIGMIPGLSTGTNFETRRELADAGVHRPLQAGICGTAKTGAESIVVSGGYEDDVDLGSVILYTGHGGKDPVSGRQVANQELDRQNLALAVSCDRGLPVRVIRGADPKNQYAPVSGYRYDGLFSVESYEQMEGRSGFLIWRFRLVEERQEEHSAGSGAKELAAATARFSMVQRRIRNTAVTQYVKEVHDFTCQICGLRIETATGGYAEGAHIRPLGLPHDGPDVASNVLCLCPNDHVRLDRGTLVIDEQLIVRDATSGEAVGPLRTSKDHELDPEQMRYHREAHRQNS